MASESSWVGSAEDGRFQASSIGCQADTKLTATEYRLLVEHSPVMSWRSGLDAKCDYFNATWLEFTGRTFAQEKGDGWAEGVHPDDCQRAVACYLDHFHRREPFEMEYRLRRHDGEYRWLFDRGAPFEDDSGEFAGFIGSCVDVHERRKAEEAQAQYNQAQLALARDFERWILAIVGHDIRTPLQTISLAAHGIRRSSAAESTVYRHAEMVTRGVKRIEHIVGDLLDLSRVREGAGISLERKSADLRVMCRQVIDEFEAIARDRTFTFNCDVEATGAWDESRILQAVSNLVSNAVQHGTPGTPVNLRLKGDAEQVAVEVDNRGVIPREILPVLFEPFRSARHHGTRGEGLGLGLFIVKAIADAHGGRLVVDSSNGATLFRLVLPRRARTDGTLG
jgi:PAS domain S-box-containing protein